MRAAAAALLLLAPAGAAAKVGVLGESGGDIQDCGEREQWTKNFFVGSLLPHSGPTAIPLGGRLAIANLSWDHAKDDVNAEYEAVGPDCNTRFREISLLQTGAIVEEVKRRAGRSDVATYGGWKWCYGTGFPNDAADPDRDPTVPSVTPGGITVYDALAQMQKDGITTGFVFDQDQLAFDNILSGVTNEHIRAYLAAHPEWDVTFYSLNGLITQPGWFDVVKAKLKMQINHAFPSVPASDVCILFPSQGVPLTSEMQNGSGIPKQRHLLELLQAAMPEYNMTIVFNNKGGAGHPPGGPPGNWSGPVDVFKVPQMAKEYPCGHVLTSPILGSWPQTDYNVYVFHGNGTATEPGYQKTFLEAGKKYANMPSWDQIEEEWNCKPPGNGGVDWPPTIGQELPRFTGKLIADVLKSGGTAGYDITVIKQAA